MQVRVTNQTTNNENYTVISPLLGHNLYEPDLATSECTLIEFMLTDTIPLNLLGRTLAVYCSKLRRKGRIVITGKDIHQVCLDIINRTLSIGEANQMIFGGPDAWELNSSMLSYRDIESHLKNVGLRITKRALNGHFYLVEGTRD